MSQQELLIRVVDVLQRLGIAYFVTGSWTSSMQGEPRSTHDLDLVVALEPELVQPLMEAFPAPEFYLAEPAVRDAIRSQSMFNLLENSEGDKVDFWMITDSPWDQSRLRRRRSEWLAGKIIYFSAPEDTILGKLRWSQLCGGSEKQFGDALRVYEVQQGALDEVYLHHWGAQLGLSDALRQLIHQAQIDST